ncbi:AAA family ATPase [Candidatus Nitrotoga sp. BS]|uniref:AAA family ATPase n=1 Tax=Candidatus Nitrotoga sp. BS TaxID=2890408 RepID=UPI001EF33136|nr:AAA family ATPase [Candidatus Nitrotoga sp. BS]CAH1198116.1 AAA family ATPase [Candidatus Nitrotoga sp. BS]
MNYIESVKVDEFWGERTLEFKFNDDVNFIIGINGSGKTTAVNIIVAALTANFSELDRSDFTKITIKLKSKSSKKKPSITITKLPVKELPFSQIVYEIKESSSDKPVTLSLDDYEEQMMIRKYPRHMLERELLRRKSQNINISLNKMVNVSWLSVNRASVCASMENFDEDDYASSVDRKLKELSNRLVRYFSTLGKKGSEQFENFQKEVFLSMLFRKGSKPFFSTAKKINLDDEKKALEVIFNQFKVATKDFKSKLDTHFDALGKAKEKLSSDKPGMLNTADISVLIGTERIDYIVEEWERSIEKRKEIFEPRDTFLQIINSMMQRKTFSINAQNELQVTTQSGKNLPIHRLSSGEKQLLIVLGEALLQEKQSWVYIADEPELSLHVRWQESLVDNLRSINPNSQIIFATHSPDVVSTFVNKIFDMECMF